MKWNNIVLLTLALGDVVLRGFNIPDLSLFKNARDEMLRYDFSIDSDFLDVYVFIRRKITVGTGKNQERKIVILWKKFITSLGAPWSYVV